MDIQDIQDIKKAFFDYKHNTITKHAVIHMTVKLIKEFRNLNELDKDFDELDEDLETIILSIEHISKEEKKLRETVFNLLE